MISHILTDSWKRSDPGTHTMQWPAARFYNSVLLHCKHSMNIHVVQHRCEGTDVFNHLLSGNLPHQVLQMLLLLPATNPSSCAICFPSPLHSTVSFCFWLLQHIHAQEQEKLPPLAPTAPTCSAPATDKFSCTNAHLPRPCHHPPVLRPDVSPSPSVLIHWISHDVQSFNNTPHSAFNNLRTCFCRLLPRGFSSSITAFLFSHVKLA